MFNRYKETAHSFLSALHGLSKALLVGVMGVTLFASCSDFLDQDSDRVIFADDEHLNSAEDTLYSVVGIINKLQAIADRTVLLGEVRGDLLDINSYTSADLRNLASFAVTDSNAYNSPREYYAVINNCNYFLAHADTALKNNRNEYIFSREYAVVKAYRAWTYLQLVLNYGSVPFVTEPILTKSDADKEYPRYDIQAICNYFINDLKGYEDVEMPEYGTIRNTDSRLFYFPIYVLEGDLNLWAGNYREAALCYYRYLSTRNGTNSAFPITLNSVSWSRSDAHWLSYSNSWSSRAFSTSGESYTTSSELITMIPGDSIPSEGNYSQLRNLFNSNANNSYHASLEPSTAMLNLSADQVYCQVDESGNVLYAPKGLSNNRDGDLRLSSIYSSNQREVSGYGMTTLQSIGKFSSRNVHIYRKGMVYLRMAEALNRAGFPRFAFQILKTGVNNQVMQDSIMPYYQADSAYLAQFDFPNTSYILLTHAATSDQNTMGIHNRGCGFSADNAYYVMPDDTTLTGTDRLNYQIEKVEDLIIDEDALETAFEGPRFYDLMRVALRRNDPSYLADRVYNRRGSDKVDEMKAFIKKDLYNTQNWYLNYQDKIGY